MLPLNLLPLLSSAWKNRVSILAGALLAALLLCARKDAKIVELEAVVAAKPKVEVKIVEKIVTKVKTVRVAGPVQVVEKIVVQKDGSKTTERSTFRSGTVTTTSRAKTADKDTDRKETPAAVSRREPRRILAVSSSLIDPGQAIGLRAGYSLFGRLDLTYGYNIYGSPLGRHRVDVAVRF